MKTTLPWYSGLQLLPSYIYDPWIQPIIETWRAERRERELFGLFSHYPLSTQLSFLQTVSFITNNRSAAVGANKTSPGCLLTLVWSLTQSKINISHLYQSDNCYVRIIVDFKSLSETFMGKVVWVCIVLLLRYCCCCEERE